MPAGEKTGSTSAAPQGSQQKRPGTQAQADSAALSGAGAKRNVDVPSWNGPEQSVGSSAANGDPFTTKLNGDAAAFSPSNATRPAGPFPDPYRDSDAADAHAGPLIVSSTGYSYHAKRPVERPVERPFERKTTKVTFSTDVGPGVATPGGHYLKVENFPAAELDRGLKDVSENFGWEKKLRSFEIPKEVHGDRYVTIWLAFDDMRDCPNAIEHLGFVAEECSVSYVTQTEFVHGVRNGDQRGIHREDSRYFDGQLTLKATYAGRKAEPEVEGLYEGVKDLCRSIGDVVAVAERIVNSTIRLYRVEFQKIKDAKFVEVSMTEDDPGRVMGWVLVASEIPDINLYKAPEPALAATPQHLRIEGGGSHFVSPTGRTAWTEERNGRCAPVPAPRQLPNVGNVPVGQTITPFANHIRGTDPMPSTPTTCMPRINHPRSESYPSVANPPMTAPHRKPLMPEKGPNVIDVEKIEKGIECRTTIMIRNIPNNMTSDQLKRVIDKVCYGRYNFVYLRFDFSKHKNVGYAFANFLTAEDVLVFYKAYYGQEYIEGMGHHPIFGPRLGEIAWATCQGQEVAIEKFRNSSVMSEYPGYRPRLFWSIEDAPYEALVSQERDFPGVNNVSKHCRSRDNAAQIGLYAPKSRQGTFIPRSSQFDRGTTAQMHEDAAFHHQQQMVQQTPPYCFNNGYVYGSQQMSMPIGMGTGTPILPYGMAYGAASPFSHAPPINMPYTPTAPAFHGHAGPMMANGFYANFNGSPVHVNGNGMGPSRLRTITNGRLGNPPRGNRFTVRPPRDDETAFREVEEGKREIAEYEAMKAQREAQEAAAEAQGADVPRFMNGDEDAGANAQEYEYPDGDYSGFGYAGNGYTDSGYANGGHLNGGQNGY